jgi:putative Mn2+ efflux pump MntP
MKKEFIMDYTSLIMISAGLAMDAFAAALGLSAADNNIKVKKIFIIALFFGMFQAIMPIIGWAIGIAGTNIIYSADHWVAFVILSYIGGKMIYDAIKSKKDGNEAAENNFKNIIILSVATSIDALATGIILPSIIGVDTLYLMLFAVLLIGIITFAISLAGGFIGYKFGGVLSDKAQIIGGAVLIFIGVKTLINHLW